MTPSPPAGQGEVQSLRARFDADLLDINKDCVQFESSHEVPDMPRSPRTPRARAFDCERP